MLTPMIPRILNRYGLARCQLPPLSARRDLKKELKVHPLYKGAELDRLLRQQQPHRLIILSNDLFAATQFAACLSAIRSESSNELLIIPPSALAHNSSSTVTRGESLQPKASLLESHGPILIAADNGPVLNRDVETEIRLYLDNPPADLSDVFIALKSSQIDSARMDALAFSYGFTIFRVEDVSEDDLSEILQSYLCHHGTMLHEKLSPKQAVAAIRQRRGNYFSVQDIFTAVDCAVHSNCKPILTPESLLPNYVDLHGSALDQLDGMIGLDELKSQMKRMIATAGLEKRRGTSGRTLCRNLTFSGSPGTGKSETARIFARALQESGCSTGVFREVGRESLVGQYVGETSLKVEKLFREVSGGVLFIDEAGALVSDGHDSFAKEAVDALVRHMENNPDTAVILATYADDMEKLLSSNDGLRSRFSRSFLFPDYSAEELWLILNHIAKQDNYTVPEDAHSVCLNYFDHLKKRKGKDFGNGREARRLFEHAVEELALRAANDMECELALSVQDFEKAAILPPAVPAPRQIGFAVSEVPVDSVSF